MNKDHFLISQYVYQVRKRYTLWTYGVHKVIPTRANNDLWPLKINKGRPLIMDNIYFFPILWSGKDVFNRVVYSQAEIRVLTWIADISLIFHKLFSKLGWYIYLRW